MLFLQIFKTRNAEKKSIENCQWPQILTIFICCIGSFNCGLLFVWTSPSIPIIISDTSGYNISFEEASYFSVIPPIATILTAPLFAFLVDRIGRKKCILFMAIPQLCSWITVSLARTTLDFYISRALAGIADAVVFVVIAMYIGEITEPRVRGTWGNLVAISIYGGQLLVNVVGSLASISTTALIFCCFPILHFILFAFMPESPYFLLMKNRKERAREALQVLRWNENVDEELDKLSNDVQRQISESGTFKDVFTIETNRKALLISIGNRATQQTSGLAAFAVYTQYMFEKAGGSISKSTASILYNIPLLGMVIVASYFVEKFGRRPLMLFSVIMCTIVLAMLSTYFYLSEQSSVDVSHLNWVPLVGMLSYVVFSSSGLGVVPTLMLGELFSASVKGKALCIMNMVFSSFILIISKIFQVLAHNYGLFAPFSLFSICCFLGIFFTYFCLPETKGKTLEEIQQALKGKKCKTVVEA